MAGLDNFGFIWFRSIFHLRRDRGPAPVEDRRHGRSWRYGWIRYSPILAPLSLWSNWLAWTPVLAIGAGLGAGYLLSIFFAADSPIITWQATLADLGFLSKDLTVRLNSTFFIGAAIMLVVFVIQHRGVLRTAQISTILTIASLIPLFIVCVIPLLAGSVHATNFQPFTPLATENGQIVPSVWDKVGVRLFLGGLFIAAWSAYAFETAVCYMSEFKNPGRDMPRAIIASGLICIVAYVTVPVVFQGVLGTQKMLDPGIADGSGMGLALASMVNAGPAITKILVILLFFSLIMAIITAMAGSSRTLNQGGRDGWLPKYFKLSKSTRRPYPRHVDRPRFQSHPVVDVELSVRAGGLKLQLPDLQLPATSTPAGFTASTIRT